MERVRRLAFFASAIAGQKVSVHESGQADTLAFSDGQSIVVPTGEDGTHPWLAVAAQAALIAAGSLDVPVLRHLLGRREAAQRYVYLEVLRASRVVDDRLPVAFGNQPELAGVEPLSESAAESLAIAKSARSLPIVPAYFGTVRPLLVLQRAASEHGLAAFTRRPSKGSLTRKEMPALNKDEQGEQSAILRLFQNPSSHGSLLGDFLNELLGAGTSKTVAKLDAGAGGEMPVGRIERSLRRGVNAFFSKLPGDLPELALLTDSRPLAYPEWDTYRQQYRRNWVFVEQVEAWRPDGLQDIRAQCLPPSRELRRQLAGLGLDHEMHRRQRDGADLDMTALIDCAIDLRTGHSPHDIAVYRASRRTRRDLAVVLVLDISGSTAEANSGTASIFSKQLQLAHQIGLTLDGLGDRLAVFGFHSWGRKLVRVVHIKGHEERWSGRILERLGMLEPVGYTRTGTAIRHGTRLLRQGMRLPNRLLVLITDGIAYDQDYEHRYGEGDSRKAMEEAKAAGIGCVCLSVGSGTETAKLREVFGAANILALDDVQQVTRRVREVCQRALSSVSQRQWATGS